MIQIRVLNLSGKINSGFRNAAIGNFDGIHSGHLELIKCLGDDNLRCLISFYPHPQRVIQGGKVKALTPLREKVRLLKLLNIDQLILIRFNKNLKSLSAKDFLINLIIKQLKVQKLVVGEDWRFGVDRSGDITYIQNLLNENNHDIFGFKKLEVVNIKTFNEYKISSTEIRKLLEVGNLEKVNTILGRDLSYTGRVVQGYKRGRQIGFPTANINLPNSYLPQSGVYYGYANIENIKYLAVINIGVRPTFNNSAVTSFEVHLIDQNIDLYSKIATISLIKKIRDEVKFDSIDQLKAQIAKDVSYARDLSDNL